MENSLAACGFNFQAAGGFHPSANGPNHQPKLPPQTQLESSSGLQNHESMQAPLPTDNLNPKP